MTPLTLPEIAALPVGARVTWTSCISGTIVATRIGPDMWRSERGARFRDTTVASGPIPTYLVLVHAPNDSAGTYEAGLDDCARPADEDAPDPLPWAGPGDMDCRCSLCAAPDLTDGTPDALPAVDACAS